MLSPTMLIACLAVWICFPSQVNTENEPVLFGSGYSGVDSVSAAEGEWARCSLRAGVAAVCGVGELGQAAGGCGSVDNTRRSSVIVT